MQNTTTEQITGKEWRAWLYVLFWSVFIFIAIPFTRDVQTFIDAQFGRTFFLYLVLGFIFLASIATFSKLRQRQTHSHVNTIWLLLVALIFVGYTFHLRKNPEEAFHFVLYSILGLLLFRALVLRVKDYSLYFSAAVLGAIIGTMDETIQWLVPGRYWGLSDIWINFLAVALVQMGIAKGFKPSFISNHVPSSSLLLLSRLLLVFLLLMQLSFLNTPPRIAWYTQNVPVLGYLYANESMMIEYGHRYDDPETGLFRSRLSAKELKQVDAANAKEAAAIIDKYSKREQYGAFLKLYTPITDPFLHELRVHLYSRNINIKIANENKVDLKTYTKYMTRAYYENNILEKYFTQTLKQSQSFWDRDYFKLLKQDIDLNIPYESKTSQHLITQISEIWLQCIFSVLIMGLIYFSVTLSRRQSA